MDRGIGCAAVSQSLLDFPATLTLSLAVGSSTAASSTYHVLGTSSIRVVCYSLYGFLDARLRGHDFVMVMPI